MANVVCEYANESPTRPTSAAAGSIQDDHPDYGSGGSMSPAAKRFASDSNFFSGISEPGRRIRRSESLLRQAADSVSKGQTFQTVSDMFQIPISTIRYAIYNTHSQRPTMANCHLRLLSVHIVSVFSKLISCIESPFCVSIFHFSVWFLLADFSWHAKEFCQDESVAVLPLHQSI